MHPKAPIGREGATPMWAAVVLSVILFGGLVAAGVALALTFA